MVNITINMSMEDFEFIKSTLLQAEKNTYISDREGAEPDKEKVKLANAQITHILNHFGW
jgi:hypothetical protein